MEKILQILIYQISSLNFPITAQIFFIQAKGFEIKIIFQNSMLFMFVSEY